MDSGQSEAATQLLKQSSSATTCVPQESTSETTEPTAELHTGAELRQKFKQV